jgi:hypothetical protein
LDLCFKSGFVCRTIVNKAGNRPLDLARSVPIKVAVAPEEENAEGYSGSESDEDF